MCAGTYFFGAATLGAATLLVARSRRRHRMSRASIACSAGTRRWLMRMGMRMYHLISSLWFGAYSKVVNVDADEATETRSWSSWREGRVNKWASSPHTCRKQYDAAVLLDVFRLFAFKVSVCLRFLFCSATCICLCPREFLVGLHVNTCPAASSSTLMGLRA